MFLTLPAEFYYYNYLRSPIVRIGPVLPLTLNTQVADPDQTYSYLAA